MREFLNQSALLATGQLPKSPPRKDPNTSAPHNVPQSALEEYLANCAEEYKSNPWPALITAALSLAVGLLVIWMLHITAAVRALEAM